MFQNDSSVHSGNYYTVGTQRVLTKLRDMGVAIPQNALAFPPEEPDTTHSSEFSWIEHAILDWFEGRDFDQAQALIHFKQSTNIWHAIYALDVARLPSILSDGMLCPSLLDALSVTIDGCDVDALKLDRCVKVGNDVVVVIDGQEALRIARITVEPFDLATRDRVRTAFKGVRRTDYPKIVARASRLPGFSAAALAIPRYAVNSDVGLFFGYPGNWATAMRNALKQVSIHVKQSQAQELAAVFFGASDWHQLIKHQDSLSDSIRVVEVLVSSPDAYIERRYYATPEEAVFAAARAFGNYPEPVALRHFDLSIGYEHVYLSAVATRNVVGTASFFEAPPEPCIESGGTDYSDRVYDDTPELSQVARELLELIATDGHVDAARVIYGNGAGPKAVLEGLLQRSNVPPEQIVYAGDYALAVRYVPEPNGSDQMASQLQLFRFDGRRYANVPDGLIAMYKSEIIVHQPGAGIMIEIRPDYGNGSPFEIPMDSVAQAKRLFSLTHAKGIFTMAVPQFC